MPDLWFFAGLAMGTAIAGFAAVGSFARGADSVRRRSWSTELVLRKRAVIASDAAARAARPRAAASSRSRPVHAAFARSAVAPHDGTVT